jgi:glucose-1-phosphate adenylyltransferase
MATTNVLTLILGGGQGTRLFPLTHMRSKPAVPIGGKYRLIDIPISNCLHGDLRRIFVLTQFNSASLNRHIAQSYRLDVFSGGFIEILAAELTPGNPHWFQGTADAVRQAMPHFVGYHDAYYLILAGDHLYRMDLCGLLDAHVRSGAEITIAAQPVTPQDAPAMGIFVFDRTGRIAGFEEKPSPERLAQMGSSFPEGGERPADAAAKPFVASMGIYVFSRAHLLDALESHGGVDFGREIIPAALQHRKVRAYFYDGYWADVGTVGSFYDANVQLTQPRAPFRFHDPQRPIFTHSRFLAPSRVIDARLADTLVAEGAFLDRCTVEGSVIGIRTHVNRGARVTRSVLLGADYYEPEAHAPPPGAPPLGIGRDAVLDRVIVDKNARIGDGVRLVNEQQIEFADGEGYYIRGGIIVVPKGGVIPPGTVV